MRKGMRTFSPSRQVVWCSFALAVGLAQAGQSRPTVVWAEPSRSLQWKTVMSSTAKVSLDWPQGATAAELALDLGKGASAVQVTDTSLTEYPLALPVPADEQEETVVGLTLTYRGEGGAVIETKTARVGLVRGVNGAPTRCRTDEAKAKWSRVKGCAVLPIPEDATALAVDSVPVSPLDAPGWWLWRDIPLGVRELALTADEGACVREILCVGGGSAIFIR